MKKIAILSIIITILYCTDSTAMLLLRRSCTSPKTVMKSKNHVRLLHTKKTTYNHTHETEHHVELQTIKKLQEENNILLRALIQQNHLLFEIMTREPHREHNLHPSWIAMPHRLELKSLYEKNNLKIGVEYTGLG